MIIEPNGVNDKRASLKYCFPKGMPIIEMQYKHPKAAAVNDNGKPVTHIQTKFSKKLHVVLLGAITYLPNGKKHKEAILKHCFPAGIPTMVIDHSIPAVHHEIPINAPPNRNQMILPRIDNEPSSFPYLVNYFLREKISFICSIIQKIITVFNKVVFYVVIIKTHSSSRWILLSIP